VREVARRISQLQANNLALDTSGIGSFPPGGGFRRRLCFRVIPEGYRRAPG